MLASSPAAVLGTRYRLGPILGEGGSGAVYAATDLSLGRTVAVKRMKLSEGADLASRADEFVREARTLAKMRHPHIVGIHDVGLDDEGKPYFVMELVEQSLAGLLEQGARLTVDELLSLLLPLCGALACAHDLGIIHCDLKPENIAVRRIAGGKIRAKLLDFGIAKANEARIVGDQVMGTPGYMAPEQLRAEPCDARTDIWALAVVACRCLCGRLPIAGSSQLELLERTAFGQPTSLRELAPELPVPLALALDRALSHAPERRYEDMRAFAKALVLAGLAAGARVPSDPDPIGLPDLPAWRGLAGSATERLPLPVHRSTTRTSDAVRRLGRGHWRRFAVAAFLAALLGPSTWTLASRAGTRQAPPLPTVPQLSDEALVRSGAAEEGPLPSRPLQLSESPPAAQSAAAPGPPRSVETPVSAPPAPAPSQPGSAPGPASVALQAAGGSAPESSAQAARRKRRKGEATPPAQAPAAALEPTQSPAASGLQLKRDWDW